MKKIISILLLLLLMLFLTIPADATDRDIPYVVDDADLLETSEELMLTQQIQNYREVLQLEIVIVTTYGSDGKGVQAYADDFYDQNGYGYGDTNSGILLLLDMEGREWYMSTCGDAIYIFTDYGLEQLGETILPWLSDGEYYRAFLGWLSALSPYVTAYRNGSSIDGYVPPDEYESVYGEEIIYQDMPVGIRIRPFPTALIIGLIAALIAIVIMRSRMNTARMQKSATNYLKDGSFRLRQRSDMFLYSRVTRTARPKNNTSGGGSSVHRSSGGVSHGGRGGRF